MRRRLRLLTLLLACAVAGPAAAQSFPAFFKAFRAAAVRGDKAAIARMTRLPFYYGTSLTTRAELMPALDALFDPKVRACFGAATPMQDGNYHSVQCGQTVYGFDANEGGWQFSGIGTKG